MSRSLDEVREDVLRNDLHGMDYDTTNPDCPQREAAERILERARQRTDEECD